VSLTTSSASYISTLFTTAGSQLTTTSTECSTSLRWVVYPNATINGVLWLIGTATTQQQCLDACVVNSSCVAVEWGDEYGCWIDDLNRQRSAYEGVTTFEIVRPCVTTSGNDKLNSVSGVLCHIRSTPVFNCCLLRNSDYCSVLVVLIRTRLMHVFILIKLI